MFFGDGEKEELIRRFRNGFASGRSASGVGEVSALLDSKEVEAVLVDKEAMEREPIAEAVKKASESGLRVLILGRNSKDLAFLKSCNGIGAVVKGVQREKERLSDEGAASLMGDFINKLDKGTAGAGIEEVNGSIDDNEATLLLVIDSAFENRAIRDCCDRAERLGIPVKVIRAESYPGRQLAGTGSIACFKEPLNFKKTKLDEKSELMAMDELIRGAHEGRVARHPSGVALAIEEKNAKEVFVNDNVSKGKRIKALIAKARQRKIKVRIFNSRDEFGMELAKNGSIACITKQRVTSKGEMMKRAMKIALAKGKEEARKRKAAKKARKPKPKKKHR